MHFTGTIWRPPYEWDSLLLEVTAGCTHHRCKFCTLYDDLPFSFRMSPLEDVEADLQEAQLFQTGPMERLTRRMQGLPQAEGPRRAFLTGANPFVLKTERLERIAELIRTYFPLCETIGCFARITDVTGKTDQELARLARAGYDGITIGVETGDDDALKFMNKGYCAQEILTQCRRLDAADFYYNFFYLAGISGAGNGERGAKATAALCNQLHPKIIGTSMLTVYPESSLYQEIKAGNWQEESEVEKYRELRVLAESLKIPVCFAALGASNAIPIQGHLPEEKETYQIGEEINEKIKSFLLSGMEKGDLRRDLEIMPAIFNFWGMLSGIIQLAANKEEYIKDAMGLSKDMFLEYGFSIIYNSIADKDCRPSCTQNNHTEEIERCPK